LSVVEVEHDDDDDDDELLNETQKCDQAFLFSSSLKKLFSPFHCFVPRQDETLFVMTKTEINLTDRSDETRFDPNPILNLFFD